MSNRLRDSTPIAVLIIGWVGMGGLQTVQTFWDSGVWFHPGGNASGRSHPGLRKNEVFLFVLFSWFGFIVFFRCNITPG